jgi:hypothetical protein
MLSRQECNPICILVNTTFSVIMKSHGVPENYGKFYNRNTNRVWLANIQLLIFLFESLLIHVYYAMVM